jgi:hypothetical protein
MRLLSRWRWMVVLDPGPGKPNILNLHIQIVHDYRFFGINYYISRISSYKMTLDPTRISSYCGKRFLPIICELSRKS